MTVSGDFTHSPCSPAGSCPQHRSEGPSLGWPFPLHRREGVALGDQWLSSLCSQHGSWSWSLSWTSGLKPRPGLLCPRLQTACRLRVGWGCNLLCARLLSGTCQQPVSSMAAAASPDMGHVPPSGSSVQLRWSACLPAQARDTPAPTTCHAVLTQVLDTRLALWRGSGGSEVNKANQLK